MRDVLEEVIVVGVSEAGRSLAVVVLLRRFVGVAPVLDPGSIDGVHFGSGVASRSHLLILFHCPSTSLQINIRSHRQHWSYCCCGGDWVVG